MFLELVNLRFSFTLPIQFLTMLILRLSLLYPFMLLVQGPFSVTAARQKQRFVQLVLHLISKAS